MARDIISLIGEAEDMVCEIARECGGASRARLALQYVRTCCGQYPDGTMPKDVVTACVERLQTRVVAYAYLSHGYMPTDELVERCGALHACTDAICDVLQGTQRVGANVRDGVN